MRKLAILAAFLLFLAIPTKGQVPVALLPPSHQQFFLPSGAPNAGGCLFFYNSGTSIAAPTYVDINGVILNTNPVILDSGGYATVYLASQAYRVTMFSTGGVNCASGSQIFVQDGINAFQPVTGALSIVFAGVTVDPAGVAGQVDYRSDIPCFRSFTTVWDCFVRLNDVQTITNKTLVSPVTTGTDNGTETLANKTLNAAIFNGQTIGSVSTTSNNPTNFTSFTNDTVTGTTVNTLTKLRSSGGGSTGVITTLGDTGGVEGITLTGAGSTGSAIIQKAGLVLCVFDGSTTVLDYVQISSTANGNCHDTGSASYPSNGGQVIGRVLTTNVGAGTYLLDLFPPEIRAGNLGAQPGCTNFTPVTVSANNALQNLQSCTIPANTLVQGTMLAIDVTGIESTAANQTLNISVSIGGGTVCSTNTATLLVGVNQPWNVAVKFSVLTAGAGGTANMSCEWFSSTNGGGVLGPITTVGAPTIAVNTTVANVVQIAEQMSVNNAGNSITGQLLKAVIF